MADVRTLKLSLLADVDKFLKGMDKADNSTKSFKNKIGDYSKAMAKSFAIAGAAAGADAGARVRGLHQCAGPQHGPG